MRGLSNAQIIDLWEACQQMPPTPRALAILAASAGLAAAELMGLTIGRRNQMLYVCRAATLGTQLAAFARCPRCDEPVEFSLDTDELAGDSRRRNGLAGAGATQTSAPRAPFRWAQQGVGYTVAFHLPTSEDLLAVTNSPHAASLHADSFDAGSFDAGKMRAHLLARCVTSVRVDSPQTDTPDNCAPPHNPQGEEVPVHALPDAACRALAAHMCAVDPCAETQLHLTCPGCATTWQAILDIGEFFWRELVVEAKRLLWEVHLLARGYGWSEADCLALSQRRRQTYVDLLFQT